MKKTLIAVSALVACFFLVSPAAALTEAEEQRISAHCDEIRSTLRTIQHEDSRVRISMGAVFGILSTNFITPLNLRLVNNDIAASTLLDFQADFASNRADFSTKFIDYSRSLEDLISTNCKTSPSEFYTKLEQTRALRAEVNKLTSALAQSATEYQGHVEALKESL